MSRPPAYRTVEFIADQIRERRLERGWSQTDLVYKLGGTGQSLVSCWETANKCPEVLSLYRLSKVFGCTIYDLLPAKEIR